MTGAAAGSGVPSAGARSSYDWTGFYVGGHVGYARGRAHTTVVDPVPADERTSFGALYGGVHAGYNHLFNGGFLIGVETDVSFPNALSRDDEAWSRPDIAGSPALREKVDFVGSLRGRAGYAFDQWLLYGTGGFAWSRARFHQGDAGDDDASGKSLRWHTGWTAGGGVEYAIEQDWSVRLEYLFTRLGKAQGGFTTGTQITTDYDLHAVRLGLTRQFGNERAPRPQSVAAGSPFDWEIHGQTTYVHQGYPAFRAPYTGANSLTPIAQSRATWTLSAFLAVRLWEGGELYYNPELLQGFGLADTAGAAGFPNGEAQKSNFAYPHYNTSRLFLRQTFGLGGPQETVESDYGQLSGKRDVSRITVQVGKFAVHDQFDGNTYSSDPRLHFMNWAIWAAGAFDYSADKVGLSNGATVELNQQHWAVRAGYFLIGNEPNSNQFDTAVFKRGEYVAELETRHTIGSQPGKLRFIAWLNEYKGGSYRDALNLVAMTPALDPTDALIQSRRGRTKFGYVINAEQSVTDDIGVFARWSWNDGRNEISAFTDIDRSLSGGVVIKGTSWGRPEDRIGMGGAVNALSRDHRDYIAAGGLGILVGDGQLNYRQEKILETYYGFNVAKGVTLTADYQYLVNPGYNADRGPVSIFTGRLHADF